MKKGIKFAFTLAIVLVCVACVGISVKFNTYQEANIIVATDTHYLSPRINDKGKAFWDMVDNSDGKMVQYCDEIFDAFSSEVIEKKPDVLIISGDLSFNGERASHEDFAKKLDYIQKNGVQVLVIAGNHDIDVKNTYAYEGKEYIPCENVNAEDFKSLYADFGMNQAESVDPYSLSYTYKINKSLYALMLDTNAYGQNFVQDQSYQWIEAQLKQIKRQGARVICVSHQNLFAHNDQLSFGYQLYDADELLAVLEKYGVECGLSGHIHMQHIVQNGVTEITTSSLLVNPAQYGNLHFDGGFEYSTSKVDVAKWARENEIRDENLLNFEAYAEDFFKSSGINKSLALLEKMDMSSEDKELIAKTFAELNTSYFAGTSISFDEIRQGIELCEKQDGFLKRYVQTMKLEAERDYNSAYIK